MILLLRLAQAGWVEPRQFTARGPMLGAEIMPFGGNHTQLRPAIQDQFADRDHRYLRRAGPMMADKMSRAAGNFGMSEGISSSYLDLSEVPPLVPIFDPLDGATNVLITKKLNVTYDQPVDLNTSSGAQILIEEVDASWKLCYLVGTARFCLQLRRVLRL